MNRPLFGLVLGGVLGIFDGLTALVSAPELSDQIGSIVIGSTFKGLVVGVLIGVFVRKMRNPWLGAVVGLVLGLALAFPVAYMNSQHYEVNYYLHIMLPGGVMGLIVGYATARWPGRAPREADA